MGDMLSTDMTSGTGHMGQDSLTGKLSPSVKTQGQGGKGAKCDVAGMMVFYLTNNLSNMGQKNLATVTASDDKGTGGTGKRGSKKMSEMVSFGLARRLNREGMTGIINNIGSDIADNNANRMPSFVSPVN